MKLKSSQNYRYQVGGALGNDEPSYVTRESDRLFYEALKAGEFCYVLNSRQMGKSSLMVRTLKKLQADGWAGMVLDFSAKDSQISQPDRWYNGIINQLNRRWQLLDNARSWIKERDFLSPVERLEEFIETALLSGISQPIVIFIDEIDSTLSLPFTDDFFALIRSCYNKRAENSEYKRLTFALLGVATPTDLISDKKRTPFNIGKAIDLKGFQLKEVSPLSAGLTDKVEDSQTVLKEILHWTGGQPFLTQRLCQLVVDGSLFISAGKETETIAKLTHSYLIANWESSDEQEHLKTIRNRLLSNERTAGELLELYRQVRQEKEFPAQNSSEERALQLSGLVVKRGGKLKVYNPIYEQVFNESWINAELSKLRPYSENFRAWVASGKVEPSWLLKGKALEEAEAWAEDKNLSGEDRDFLSASRTQQREAEIAEKEKEAELKREKELREAAEEAERIQGEANRQAQRRIRIGTIVLGLALLGGLICFGWGVKEAKDATMARGEREEAIRDKEIATREADKQRTLVINSQQQLKEQKEELKQLSLEANSATEKYEQAKGKLEEAEEKVKYAQGKLNEALEKQKNAEETAKRAIEATRNAQAQKQQVQIELERAKDNLVEAQESVKQSQDAVKKAQAKQEKAELELAKTNQALKAVRGLSQLAGQLRKKGQDSASDEALRKAGLSTLIENEELKQVWLMAATAEAYPSLGDERLKDAQETVEQLNLNSLNNSPTQVDSRIVNQVKAFAYFQTAKFKDEENYQYAYDALKASNFNPYNREVDTDILTEKDVENIYWELIKLRKIDINSSNEIATEFRQHLYDGLHFLLKQDLLREADIKTFEIMLYIAQRVEEGFFSVESLENFSCPALKEIDKRWLNSPSLKNHFGFSKQKEIWEKLGLGSPTYDSPNEDWRKFYIEVGWKTEESGVNSSDGYMRYNELGAFRDYKSSKQGNLPRSGLDWTVMDVEGYLDGDRESGVIRHGGVYLFSSCEL